MGNVASARQLADTLDSASQRSFDEEIGSRIRDVPERPVQLAAARGGVRDIAHRDLVADDERRGLVAREQPLARVRVTERGLVEALAAGEALLPVRMRRRLAVGVERLALEVANADVAEIVLDEMRHRTACESEVRGLERAGEGRDGDEVERQR